MQPGSPALQADSLLPEKPQCCVYGRKQFRVTEETPEERPFLDFQRCSPVSLLQENEILTEQEELLAMEQFLRRQIASEKEEIERLRAEIAEIQR